jgi:hypothetical protein
MSRRPKPLEYGDHRHIPWGSVRWSIARQMRLLAEMAGGSAQYAAILAGADVALTKDQVRGFVPESRRPANLEAHAVWVLRGDDTLEPAP